MTTAKKSAGTMTGGRKKGFRATAGLTIDQQLQMASQLQAQGDNVLKTIQQMKKSSKKQQQTTKANNLKFEWLQEHSHIKKLEENYSKELEAMLLRMYNDASTARESKKVDTEEGGDNNGDSKNTDPATSAPRTSSSTSYAVELEELLRTEQLHRVALIQQITSEREQRAALKQLIRAVSEGEDVAKLPAQDNQLSSDDMRTNVRDLIYDAVIGRQMIEATLEEEMQACDKGFGDCYRKLLETLRDTTGSYAVDPRSSDDDEQKISSIIKAVGGSECSDEMLRIEIADAFRKAFMECREDLTEYEQEFVNAASDVDAAGSIEAATSRWGGWRESDDERFVKVLRSYEGKQGLGKKLQLLYDQITLVLPSIPMPELKRHVKFHQHLRFHQHKRKDRQREFHRKLGDLQDEATTKFKLSAEQEQERLRKMQQLSEMRQQCEQLHGQVSQWRVTQEAKDRIERQQRELEEMIELQRQQEEALRSRRKHEQQKLIVEEFKKGKSLKKLANERQSFEEQQHIEEDRALRSVVNAERVEYRQHEFQRKLDEMKQEELFKAELEDQRVAKLNALKEKTPYAQIIANIVPDPERTRQETAAFRANIETAQEGLPITETGLFPSHGYDCETLFKNARFKLGIALRNAGLGSNEYARQALANVKVCNAGAYRNHVSEPTKLW